tara:strand:+ start:797 stop:1486 length:690 start_codon:yes stop_codon:yes gene_type:complete
MSIGIKLGIFSELDAAAAGGGAGYENLEFLVNPDASTKTVQGAEYDVAAGVTNWANSNNLGGQVSSYHTFLLGAYFEINVAGTILALGQTTKHDDDMWLALWKVDSGTPGTGTPSTTLIESFTDPGLGHGITKSSGNEPEFQYINLTTPYEVADGDKMMVGMWCTKAWDSGIDYFSHSSGTENTVSGNMTWIGQASLYAWPQDGSLQFPNRTPWDGGAYGCTDVIFAPS